MGHIVVTYWYLLILFPLGIYCFFSPCTGLSSLGEACDGNGDCEHKGSICLRGRCRCHPHYVEVVDEKSKAHHCHLLPARISAPCSSKCREPLFCRNGECQCVQRGTTTIINGECVSVSRVGDRCSRHYDCSAPFSACLNNQCVCISGTIQQGSRCVAAANCPFGGLPGISCTVKASPGMAYNIPPNQSNCPSGQMCITAEDSPIGHCCPVVCPLASHVDTKYSCDPNNATLTRCPSDTHFCHLLSDGRSSQAVCCRRPCNAMAPNALYANNDCLPRGQLNSACTTNAQCGGGESMQCVKGQCECLMGFVPTVDSLTHNSKNPSQTCTRSCDSMDLSRDTSCMKPVLLGTQCFVQQQCPPNSGCYRGRCMCKCKFEMSKGGKCVPLPPPPTTTQKPHIVVPGLNVPQGGFFDQIIELLGPASKSAIGSFIQG